MPDPLELLPIELAIKIFRDAHAQAPQGNTSLNISWVSRSWRHLALADAQLWSTLSMRRSSTKLTAFLERSQPLPFELICRALYRIDHHTVKDVVAVISQNLERFRSLELEDFGEWNPLAGIDGRELPFLTSVRWYETHCDCLITGFPRTHHRPVWTLPAQWATRVPALRVLKLEHFLFAESSESRPLVSSRTLAAHDLDESFTFALFPGLQTLHLQGMSDRCLPHLLALPLSIQSVTLESCRWFSGDYSPFYRGLLQRRLPHLKMLSVHGLKAGSSHGIALILQTTTGPYHVYDCFATSGLRIESPFEGVYHEIVHAQARYPCMWGRDVLFVALLSRISSLSLHVSNLQLLESKHVIGMWDRSMPELLALTLVSNAFHSWDVGRLQLRAPQLQEVVFLSGGATRFHYGASPEVDHAEVITKTLPRVLSNLLLPPHGLARITVRTTAEPEAVVARDLAALGGMARVLCLRDWDTGVETEIPLPNDILAVIAALRLSMD